MNTGENPLGDWTEESSLAAERLREKQRVAGRRTRESSERQSNAVYHLRLYSQTGDEEELRRYEHIRSMQTSQRPLRELFSSPVDFSLDSLTLNEIYLRQDQGLYKAHLMEQHSLTEEEANAVYDLLDLSGVGGAHILFDSLSREFRGYSAFEIAYAISHLGGNKKFIKNVIRLHQSSEGDATLIDTINGIIVDQDDSLLTESAPVFPNNDQDAPPVASFMGYVLDDRERITLENYMNLNTVWDERFMSDDRRMTETDILSTLYEKGMYITDKP